MKKYIYLIAAFVFLQATFAWGAMISKWIPYGAAGDGWFTGIALSSRSSETIKIVGEYWDEGGKLVLQRVYNLRPHAINAFSVSEKLGRFSAVFYSASDFGMFSIIGRGGAVFRYDYFPTSFSPPLEQNDSVRMVGLGDSLYYTVAGKLRYLPEKYATAFIAICRAHFLETGVAAPLMDLNTQDGSQSDDHPKGAHIWADVDVAYTGDFAVDWKLMRRCLAAFPEAIIQVHATIWTKLTDEMTAKESSEYQRRILRDTNATWHHDLHWHLHPGGRIEWAKINL